MSARTPQQRGENASPEALRYKYGMNTGLQLSAGLSARGCFDHIEAAAVRAPLLAEGPPPAVGVTAVVAALGIFAVQTLVAASAVAPRERLRAASRQR